VVAGTDPGRSVRVHPDATFGHRNAMADRLCADIHHMGLSGGVKMCEVAHARIMRDRSVDV